jgi:THO complex subunit 1
LWDLFDIILVLSDEDHCDPTLLLWLVEELLDSETIAGCRKVFDYLESRRERITAKPSSAKNLVILRSCNELLRRLSRADDTAFCGRVFIFLFQSFPLGDKSSVNLRGEYHVENVTTYDHVQKDSELMDVDVELSTQENKDADTSAETAKPKDPTDGGKGVTFSNKESDINSEELYPIFWSMQQFFNQPTKLFDAANFTSFKSALESTLSVFKTALSVRSTKAAEEATRKSKRKRSLGTDELADSFNPKYLTSRDLFDLEVCLEFLIRDHSLIL